MWALFHKDKQISKAHTTKIPAHIEALERRLYFQCRYGIFLPDGYEVKELIGIA